MGCMHSKSHLETVDDSVHVMLKRDKKTQQKHGEKPSTGYVPRAPHPLMNNNKEQANGGGVSATEPSTTEPSPSSGATDDQ